MDIEPATVQQVIRGRDGRLITIDDDVQGVARNLKAINEGFKLRYSEAGEYFVIYFEYQEGPNRKQYMVCTAQELDARITKRIEQIASEDYDFVGEFIKTQQEADKERDRVFKERTGEIAERLAHALRKDLGVHYDAQRSKKSWGKGKGVIGYHNGT